MKVIYLTSLIVLCGLFVALSVFRPAVMAENAFLKDFVGKDMLGIVGVMMSIAIPSIATVHIWFNELEQRHDARVFGAARREINTDAISLIWIFLILLTLLFVKPFFENSSVIVSMFNSACLMLLIGGVISLVDILRVIRQLTPED